MFKRIVSLFLCLLMLATAFISCGEKRSDDNSDKLDDLLEDLEDFLKDEENSKGEIELKKELAELLKALEDLDEDDEEYEDILEEIEYIKEELENKKDLHDDVAEVATSLEEIVTSEMVYTTAPFVVEEPKYQNFGGRTFRILSAGNVAYNDFNYEYDDSSYTVVERAQYERVQQIENNYNVDIVEDIMQSYSSASSGSPGKGFTSVLTQVNSGSADYDLCLIAGYDVSQLATLGYLYDLNAIPQIDLSESYWDQNAVKDLSINGITFFTTGDITLSEDTGLQCMLFNKRLADDYQIENPYDLVLDGKWTIEKLADISKKISADVNQDGVYDTNDLYGLLVYDDSIVNMLTAAGQRCATINEQGELELTFMNESTVSALDTYAEIAYDEVHALQYQRFNNSGPGDEFWMRNHGVFYFSSVGNLPNYSKMENDFGVLPYPKLSQTQENYYSCVYPFGSQFICVPIVVSDISCIGTITEALAKLGDSGVNSAFYDILITGMSLRDEESVEMLDIIRDNIVYDIGHYYQVGPYNKELIKALRVKNSSWMSLYDTYLPAAKSQIKAINDAYSNIYDLWK